MSYRYRSVGHILVTNLSAFVAFCAKLTVSALILERRSFNYKSVT